jgi:hypothetical protein
LQARVSARWESGDGVTRVELITLKLAPPARQGQRVLAPGDGEHFVVTEHGFVRGCYSTVDTLSRAVDLSTLQEVAG